MKMTDELRSLVRQRKHALEHRHIARSMQAAKALRYLETQLCQQYSPAERVQASLLVSWWPHVAAILPSPTGRQRNTNFKWKKRYETAQKNICAAPQLSF